MASFTNEEYADIFFCYGYCNGDAAAARREYQTRYPDRRLPDASVFSGIYRRIRETGRAQRRQSDAGRPRVYAPDGEEEILKTIQPFLPMLLHEDLACRNGKFGPRYTMQAFTHTTTHLYKLMKKAIL